ncbi:MAG: hypothetical protein IKR09_04105 [Alphaproteobacteria bacterium]|nr:hypothetical protein [Alphaproteobacteria bacterium]
MKRRIFLTGLLTLALLTPVSDAKAQGWPTFDVAKLASLITNLIGRFQPIPQVLSRVSQVKTAMSQIKAVGQAVTAGNLKSLGKAASEGLRQDAFTNGRAKNFLEKAATGVNGATDAAKKAKSALFSLNKNKTPTIEDFTVTNNLRKNMSNEVSSEVLSTSLYLAFNAPQQSIERFKKADEALAKAETIQDSVNANTMMIMVGNYERLNQIMLSLLALKQKTMYALNAMPTTGFAKPEAIKDLKMGDSVYTEQEKDEADVNFD